MYKLVRETVRFVNVFLVVRFSASARTGELARLQSEALSKCHRGLASFRHHSCEARAYLRARQTLDYERREALAEWTRSEVTVCK